jgi:tetratricopeptide (TPR) repeat protein
LFQARANLEESVHIAETLQDALTLVFSLGYLGWTLNSLGDYDAGTAALTRAVALGRTLGVPGQHAIGLPLSLLGDIPYLQGDWSAARRLYEESIRYIRQIHNLNFLTYPLRRLAYVDLRDGRLAQAAAGFSESLALNGELHHRQGQCACLVGFANLRLAESRPEAAAALCGFVEAQLQRLGLPLYRADSAELEHCTALVQALLADEPLAAARAAGQAMGMKEAVAEALKQDE